MNSTRTCTLLLAISFGLGCGATAMNSPGSGGAGGQSTASGGSTGNGGSAASGGITSTGGTLPGSGGAVTGGKGGSASGGIATGGTGMGGTVTGGKGGTVTGGMGGKGGSNAGGAGGIICTPPGACPTIGCLYGEIPNPDRCGCPICAPAPDAGADSGKLACVDLDECTCLNTKGCSPIAEACYCPTQCTSAVCACGGGQFLGCAPQAQGTCATAKDRVAALCPTLKGAVFDGLCQQTDSLCVTKCLNAVASCGELTCSMCEGCDCASDVFMRCRAECGKVLAQ